MSRSDDLRIADILAACDEIAGLVRMRDADSVPTAVLTRAAERVLEVIGEAATALSEESRGRYPEVSWRDMSRLRVVLAHHYQWVDPAQVWNIARDDIPRLATALRGPTP